jgi:hypothetical protein
MSQPQIAQNMFYIEGQTTAVLVTRTGRKMTQTHPPFATPILALEWCIKNRAGFTYVPAVPNN